MLKMMESKKILRMKNFKKIQKKLPWPKVAVGFQKN